MSGTDETLRVLSNNCHVDHSSSGSLDALDRSYVGVEIHLLTESDDGRAVAGDLVRRARNGTEHGSVAFLLQRLDRDRRQRGSRLLEALESCIQLYECRLGDPSNG